MTAYDSSAAVEAVDTPARIERLKLPERRPIAGTNARDADIELLAGAPADFLDTTHFDTVRFPPPPWAVERFAEAAKDGSLAYTGYRGHPRVLASASEAVSNFLDVPIDPEQNILLTPGTQAGLFSALAGRIESEQRVVVMDPDYLFTARILRFLNCNIGYVPLIQTEEGLHPDLNALEREFAVNNARHLVFSHPNNPTGAVFSPKIISEIATLVKRYNVQVVADELYSRLIYDDKPFTHLAAEPDIFEHVVTLLGPSKTESLSGYRLGVVIGSSNAIARMEDVLSITALRAPAYAQHVLIPWLRDDHAWLAGLLEDFKSLRKMTLDRFRELPWVKISEQAGTAYAWPDVSKLDVPDPVISNALMKDAHALISPGYQFGPTANGHFRVCYARDEGQWDRSLDRIVDVLDRMAIKKGLPARVRT